MGLGDNSMIGEKEYIESLKKYKTTHKEYYGYGHSNQEIYLLIPQGFSTTKEL